MGARVRTVAPAVRWSLVGLGLPYVDCHRLRARCPERPFNLRTQVEDAPIPS